MRAPVAVLIVIFGAIICTEAKPQAEKYILRAKVIETHIISPVYDQPLPPNVIQIDFDARFALTVRVVSVKPALEKLAKGRTVIFAIHSPTMLFGTPKPQGKVYDFTLRAPQPSEGRMWFLQVRWPNQAMQPTARGRTASLSMTKKLSFQINHAPTSGG